jgi:SEC-C motif-containing protein
MYSTIDNPNPVIPLNSLPFDLVPQLCNQMKRIIWLIILVAAAFQFSADELKLCKAFDTRSRIIHPSRFSNHWGISSSRQLTQHFAKKPSRKSAGRTAPTTGFGGASLESCPCGSSIPYSKCCGTIHRDPAIYATATAEQVVRARYSAFSKRVIDFIISSTHPGHESYDENIQRWRQSLEKDCYDNYILDKCDILETHIADIDNETVAVVRFVALMTQRNNNERMAFEETSTFKRQQSTGPWQYVEGVVVAK